MLQAMQWLVLCNRKSWLQTLVLCAAALEALQWLFEATRPASWRASGRGPPRPPVHLRREGVGAARPGASKLSGGLGWDAEAAAPEAAVCRPTYIELHTLNPVKPCCTPSNKAVARAAS